MILHRVPAIAAAYTVKWLAVTANQCCRSGRITSSFSRRRALAKLAMRCCSASVIYCSLNASSVLSRWMIQIRAGLLAFSLSATKHAAQAHQAKLAMLSQRGCARSDLSAPRLLGMYLSLPAAQHHERRRGICPALWVFNHCASSRSLLIG